MFNKKLKERIKELEFIVDKRRETILELCNQLNEIRENLGKELDKNAFLNKIIEKITVVQVEAKKEIKTLKQKNTRLTNKLKGYGGMFCVKSENGILYYTNDENYKSKGYTKASGKKDK